MRVGRLYGQLDALKWLHKNGHPWDEWTCSWAAQGGHLEVLKWAYNYGCPWDERTCSWAAELGHLEVLKWARANECPWDRDECIKTAVSNGHNHVAEWISAYTDSDTTGCICC